ncbi:putative RNA-directed DNA polymerase [Dioscorea sansibarensis]
MTFESRIQHQSTAFQLEANAVSRNSIRGGRSSSQKRGGGGGRGRIRSQQQQGHSSSCRPKPTCQICHKVGHEAISCWHRYNQNYQPEDVVKMAAAATTTPSYPVNTDWYIDSGATYHITNELERLSTRERYRGADQVQVANGTDNATQRILHQGKCRNGLYNLAGMSRSKARPTPSRFQAFLSVRPSEELWHRRLGQPASSTVQAVLQCNKLDVASFTNDSPFVCDACQQAKSHQLPFQLSSNVSKKSLELIHSDVWGPAIAYVRGLNIIAALLMTLASLLGYFS